jgi:signal transduction histidine kinase
VKKLNLKNIPFRYKVTFTLSIIVISTTFLSFYFFEKALIKEYRQSSEKNIISIFSILKESYLFNLKKNGGKILYSLLNELSNNNVVSDAYLFNSQGEITYSTNKNSTEKELKIQNRIKSHEKDISIINFESGDQLSILAIMKVNNKKACYSCHLETEKILGYIAVDVPVHGVDENLTLVEEFSYVLTITLIIFLLLGISILHSKTIKKSLKKFQKTIALIEDGNLKERIEFEPEAELVELANNFNNMLDKLEHAQSEIEEYHKHELLNTKKLATIGEMAASIAHEIRNPLSGISNAVEILCEEKRDNDNKPVFEEVRRQIKRVNNTLNDLLQFARPVDLDLKKGNMNDIIKLIVIFVKSQIRKKKILFKLNLANDIPDLKFDHVQMENCLINLIMNAVAAIKIKGEIVISTYYKNKNEVVIEIADNGIGIPKENIPKIFEPFFTTRHQGTGLGLSIVKDIIKRHNAEIKVKENQGRGTIFQIIISVIA